MKKIKLKSCFMTRIGRLDRDYIDIIREAARTTLAETDTGRISDVYFASFAPRELCGIADPVRNIRNSGPDSTGPS
jgi:hypothetical protein